MNSENYEEYYRSVTDVEHSKLVYLNMGTSSIALIQKEQKKTFCR